MEHSFAASPRMLFPFASTFTWKLVNRPNCEIIRGEVSIFRGGAGGLSYFSSGSFRGTLYVGASWTEALTSTDNKTKQIKKLVFDIIKYLKLKKADRISEHARGVHQIFFNAQPESGSSHIPRSRQIPIRRRKLVRTMQVLIEVLI